VQAACPAHDEGAGAFRDGRLRAKPPIDCRLLSGRSRHPWQIGCIRGKWTTHVGACAQNSSRRFRCERNYPVASKRVALARRAYASFSGAMKSLATCHPRVKPASLRPDM